MSFKEIQETTQSTIENQHNFIEREFSNDKNLYEILKFSLSENGVAFRPYLIRIGIELNNLDYKAFLPILSAIEFVQKSTLVLDDILDDSPLRNGYESVYYRYGVKFTVVCGEILRNIGNRILRNINNLSEKQRFQIINELEISYDKVYKGQFYDVLYENSQNITEEQYFEMIYLTTGSFIESSLIIGLIISNIPFDYIDKLRLFGKKLGIAYQMRDDIVNLVSDESNGKVLAEDLMEKKKRLPMIHYLNNASKRECQQFLSLWNNISFKEENKIYMMLEMLHEQGSIEYTKLKLNNLITECFSILDNLGDKFNLSKYRKITEMVGQL